MSQLQIGLVSLGALIILVVLLFNWWQERNIRREMFRRFEGPIDDVLMDQLRTSRPAESEEEFRIDTDAVFETREDPQVEASVEEHSAENVEESPVEDVAIEAVSETEAEPLPSVPEEIPEVVETEEEAAPIDEFALGPIRLSDPEPEIPAETELPPLVDPHIDEIAVIRFTQPCKGAVIRDALQPLPVFSKSVRWLGQSGDAWLLLTREQEQTSFTSIICALQLADRSGPANGEDLRNFHAKVEELADRIGGAVEWREHGDPLQFARDLDQFCIDVDVMISLQLIAGSAGPFAGTKLRGLAEAGGLTLKEDGQFHFLGDEGESRFILACLDKRTLTPEVLRTVLLRGVVLMMDVPRVANGVEVFNQMVLLGRKLESALSSRLMDENQQPLGDAEIEKIRQQLKIIYSSMFARGIVPGSMSALRLFS